MRRIILRYGLYAAIFIIVLGTISFTVLKSMSYSKQEVFGYLSIFVSLIFVFIGMKKYRDQVNRGKLGFGEGLKLGLMIVLIPSVAFGLLNIVYTEIINQQWLNEYYNYYIDQLKSLPAAEYEEKKKEILSQKEFFSSPLIQFVVMSLTVFIMGLIVTVISALTLRRG